MRILKKKAAAPKAAGNVVYLREAARRKYEGFTDPALSLALKLDQTVKRVRPDAWRGNQAKENTIKAALLPLLGNDVAEVERMFLIIKAQREY